MLEHVRRLRVFAGIGVGFLVLGVALALGGDVHGGGLAAVGLGLALWEALGLWLARKQVASSNARPTTFSKPE